MSILDQFADIRILRYEIPEFEQLPIRKKQLLYFLSQAALCGRDIVWQQNYRGNLLIRRALECIYKNQRNNDKLDIRLATYMKRVWFANGIHHHYSNDKFEPEFTSADFRNWVFDIDKNEFESQVGMKQEELIAAIEKDIFDPIYKNKKVCLDNNTDLVESSAVNFYNGVTQQQVEAFYQTTKDKHALNSTLATHNGEIQEYVWRIGGLYGEAIGRISHWLKKAMNIADNETQKEALKLLLSYYETGDNATFDKFNIEWVKEKSSTIDFINGFIEVYSDPLGLKATWESIVQLVDEKATRQISNISEHAQWFEDNSPIDIEFRKKKVTGVSMRVINAVMLGGDCYPATPIGVNLPNEDWIREEHGSKSISLSNITHAHHCAAADSGVLQEFAASEDEIARSRKYSQLGDDLHTQLHECLGHGSGCMKKGCRLDDLKAYGSTIEEARADLFALYFMADEKMIDFGLIPTLDVAWAHYDAYLRNGLLIQMARIAPNKNIEESHMRNRQLICRWVLEQARQNHCVEIYMTNNKHYVKINDYNTLRNSFGILLNKIQFIKSTGDFEEAKKLVENYGVETDKMLHNEVIARYKRLNVAPFSGFVNPRLTPIMNGDKIIDVEIDYNEQYDEQMLRYSEQYSWDLKLLEDVMK